MPVAPETAAYAGILGMALVGWAMRLPTDRADVRRSRLYNRYRIASGWRWAVRLREAGIESVCIKGLAAAATIYPESGLRAMADADLLLRTRDLGPALQFFLSQGFAVGQEPTRHSWGFIGDASAEPLISPEGSNIDLHRHPDAWPLHKGLSTEAVMAASRNCSTMEGEIRVPCREHQLLIAASNAARDLFDPPSLKLLIDGAFILMRQDGAGTALDWQEVERRAAAGDSLRGLRSYLSLIGMLGFDLSDVPARLRSGPSDPGAWLLRSIAAELGSGRFGDPEQDHGLGHKLLREVLLSASLRTVLWRNIARLSGLARPNRGMLADLQ